MNTTPSRPRRSAPAACTGRSPCPGRSRRERPIAVAPSGGEAHRRPGGGRPVQETAGLAVDPEQAAPPAAPARHPRRRLRRRSRPTAPAAACRPRAGTARGLFAGLRAWQHVTPGSTPVVRIRGSIRPEEKQKMFRAGRSLAVQQGLEADPGVGPVLVGGGTRDADHLGGVLDRQPGEVAELDQPGGLGVLGGQAGQGLVDVEQFVRRRGEADVGGVEGDPTTLPPRLSACLRRA